MQLPIWCACGQRVTFSNESRCEDCYALDMHKFKIKGVLPYAVRGNPPEPDNTYEKLIERDNNERASQQPVARTRLLRSERPQAG